MNETKTGFARLGVMVFIVAFGARLVQQAKGVTPVAAHAGETSPHVVRLEWLTHCPQSDNQLGLYTRGEARCHPTRQVSVDWLQTHLLQNHVLTEGETLSRFAHPTNSKCGAVILAGANRDLNGWICFEGETVYRTSLAGQTKGAAFQVWVQ